MDNVIRTIGPTKRFGNYKAVETVYLSVKHGEIYGFLGLTNFVAIGLPGLLPYFPWGIPALYSGISGIEALPRPGMVSFMIPAAVSVCGFIGTAAWWSYADQM